MARSERGLIDREDRHPLGRASRKPSIAADRDRSVEINYCVLMKTPSAAASRRSPAGEHEGCCGRRSFGFVREGRDSPGGGAASGHRIPIGDDPSSHINWGGCFPYFTHRAFSAFFDPFSSSKRRIKCNPSGGSCRDESGYLSRSQLKQTSRARAPVPRSGRGRGRAGHARGSNGLAAALVIERRGAGAAGVRGGGRFTLNAALRLRRRDRELRGKREKGPLCGRARRDRRGRLSRRRRGGLVQQPDRAGRNRQSRRRAHCRRDPLALHHAGRHPDRPSRLFRIHKQLHQRHPYATHGDLRHFRSRLGVVHLADGARHDTDI